MNQNLTLESPIPESLPLTSTEQDFGATWTMYKFFLSVVWFLCGLGKLLDFCLLVYEISSLKYLYILKDVLFFMQAAQINFNFKLVLKYSVQFINFESPKIIFFNFYRCMEISSIAALLRIKSLEKVKVWATYDI